MCLLRFSLKLMKMRGSGYRYSRVFIAILEQLSQYPRGNNAIRPVRITRVPKRGLLVVLGGPGVSFGSLWGQPLQDDLPKGPETDF